MFRVRLCIGIKTKKPKKPKKPKNLKTFLKNLRFLPALGYAEETRSQTDRANMAFDNPSNLRQGSFTIQPPRSTRTSSILTLLRPSITSSLKFDNRSIAIAIEAPSLKQTPASIVTNT